ncbi:megakaryocyte and platelet inhibitory receptor G6b isoform X4 [Rousettus aegyptiacus]|uniref:Megakaryocyte and platelet inhibitory receptor G6b n=1 Tax=Rousettus aegyptiacus TaxID=9407 RepID=A0A7J8KCS7_ROUAE|nr:megakaryocyte and platelet inhibitory receptor G6b isoform X4 [Rousettus aegyptiacus]KAF6506622.1 megakaryocyte and platelet inhibitory receptor G6b [Rousettus aegyptiacus]
MSLFLQLLPLLLSRAQADSGLSLEGRPGDRVNLSCVGVSYPIRWAWAPSFPACKGLSKGRRPILWASSRATPTVSPVQLFAGRLRALDPGIRRLELLLNAGDSGTFICRGRREDESRTVIHVLGDGADCRAPEPSQGARPRTHFDHSPDLLCPPQIAPLVKDEPQRSVTEEEPKIAGDLDQEPSLLYADLDCRALRRPGGLSPVVPADASTIYAVVV